MDSPYHHGPHTHISTGSGSDGSQRPTAVRRAREALRKELSGLVIAGAEQVLQESVDASKHEALLEKLAGEL